MKKRMIRLLSDIFLLLIVVVCGIPFLYMFLMSFKSTINALNFSISPELLTLEQYQKIFVMKGFPRAIFNSFFVAFAGVILVLIISTLAGFAFAKLKFKGNDKLFFFMMMTMVVPSEVIIVPLFLIMKNLGLLNTYFALILPLPGAFGIFIMRQAVMDIPDDLIDAARIDGCGRWAIFTKIVLPLIRSAMLALAIFTFVGAWNNYTWVSVAATKTEMKTLPLALSMMKTQFDSDVGLTMACAVINFLPPFIFYCFLQKQFKEGMTMSGLKG